MDRIAGIEETRIPTVGSTTDQSMGTPIAQVVSGLTRRDGRKERRMQEVMTALYHKIIRPKVRNAAKENRKDIQKSNKKRQQDNQLSFLIHLQRANDGYRQQIHH